MGVTKGDIRTSDYNSYDTWVVVGVSRVIDPTSSLGGLEVRVCILWYLRVWSCNSWATPCRNNTQ